MLFRHLEFILYSLQAAKEVLSLTEDGEEPRGIPVNHDTEDKILPLGTDTFELVWDRDEPLHFSEIACSHLLKWRTELQTPLPIQRNERGNGKRSFFFPLIHTCL